MKFDTETELPDNLYDKITIVIVLYEEEFELINQCLESIKNFQNLVVYLTTNNSKIPDERWHKSFKKCKMVNICISVDGIEEVGEFVRLGMNFERYSKKIRI